MSQSVFTFTKNLKKRKRVKCVSGVRGVCEVTSSPAHQHIWRDSWPVWLCSLCSSPCCSMWPAAGQWLFRVARNPLGGDRRTQVVVMEVWLLICISSGFPILAFLWSSIQFEYYRQGGDPWVTLSVLKYKWTVFGPWLPCPVISDLGSGWFSGKPCVVRRKVDDICGYSTHQQWVREIREVRNQDTHQGTHHNEHCAHTQHHHRPISYQLSVAGTRRRLMVSEIKNKKETWENTADVKCSLIRPAWFCTLSHRL